jgi:hypothetical protein
MIKGRGGPGLVDEPLFRLEISGKIRREELQGYESVEVEILGFVHHTHSACAEGLQDLVVRNRLTNEGIQRTSFLTSDPG